MEGLHVAFKKDINQIKSLLMNMGLNEYQASALTHLILVGETKPTTLSKASGLPSARIYGVLDELSKMGLVTIRPGRPTLHKARSPKEVAGALISFSMSELKQRLKTLEDYAKHLTIIGNKIYLKGKRGVPSHNSPSTHRQIGDVYLEDAGKLYDAAKEEILILSRVMEYLAEVAETLKKAPSRRISPYK